MDNEIETIDRPVPKNRPWLTVFLALLVFGAYLAVLQAVAGLFLAAEMQKNPNLSIEEWLERAQYNGQLLAVATLAATFICVPLILLAARLVSRGRVRELLGLRMPTAKSALGWFVAMAALIAVIDGLTWVSGRELVPLFMRQAYLTVQSPILFWLALLIAAPLNEELLVRGLLLGSLERSSLGPIGAAVISSMAWAAVHVQYDLFGVVSIFAGGLFLAAARHFTQSVVLCILLHATMNLVATIELLVVLRGE
jgi:membrane protease YdiL (CAAX protease family)